MSYKITIPEPCHENWQAMTPTQKGAFCETCAKEVFDFTQVSRTELARKLERGDSLCGRFRPDQLDTPLPALSRGKWRELMIAAGFSVLLLGSCTPEDVATYPENIETRESLWDSDSIVYIQIGEVIDTLNTRPAHAHPSPDTEDALEEIEGDFLFGEIVIVED